MDIDIAPACDIAYTVVFKSQSTLPSFSELLCLPQLGRSSAYTAVKEGPG